METGNRKPGERRFRARRLALQISLGATFLWVAGCATSAKPVLNPPLPPPPPPAPQISQPAPKPKPHAAVASWYGPGLDGHKTATGETFNKNALTAASPTLPLGSHVTVTNPKNGKSVTVKINDRGPVPPGRSLDLSERAAKEIGIKHSGKAHVLVTKATPVAESTPESD